ncbi:hypothetical protein VB712_09135 [Spirulina sp. CCNP1310]|uniref:hypothetical protein n=1 Tax=Spirulina sp. CCNP1310 TaxID=3110249 RepID=UPI002B209117|nr:hypothetical protein [Spirulina sp. CCNP1310]MEA5419391.1 hypothetical protein [Spirulina sp. CCNP1310]
MNYKRDLSELKTHATLWWPESLKEKNALANVLPLLLRTQDDFLRLLHLSKKNPFQLFDLIKSAGYPANLFLKHLVVLADYGGEPIQRLGKSFSDIFPKDQDGYFFEFIWRGKSFEYRFKAMPVKNLNNKRLQIDGDGLTKENDLNDLTSDMIAILLFAATSNVANQARLDACDIGSLLGNSEALESFVKQRYITVSRITGGATANKLGQLAQTELLDFLQKRLGSEFIVVNNGTIHLKNHENSQGMPFDIVVSKRNTMIGIEVSFQVTTNSTIERKAGQAADRRRLMSAEGHRIAYVIDGAGNFQRSSAISTICTHSDCTIAYSLEEFEVLSQWIESQL